jgi:predicted metal-dependent phosphoesterase TrpH
MELPLPSTPLFGNQARTEIDRRGRELAERERILAVADRRDDLRTALERAIEARTNAQRNLHDAETRLGLEQSALGQLAGNTQTELLAALPPARDYCDVRMSLAREQGCPLAATRPNDLTSRRAERSAAEDLELQRRLVETLEASAAANASALKVAERATTDARRDFVSAATAFDEQRGKLLDERARLTQISRLVDDAESAWRQASEQTQAISRMTREIDESYDRQEQLRSERLEAIGRFSARFDYVVRAILGDEVSGRVDTAGRSLSLLVDEHGERDSAAIATVKLLAFDLAALTASAEGQGTFPRFLMHDGPREADIAPEIYERLFLYARELEKCFSGEPSFQYIVTTTTPPPDAFQKDPWLRLRLAGAPAEERLLRSDL